MKEIIDSLKIVLEFVERCNKQDKEREVAEAAQVLEGWIEEEKIALTCEEALAIIKNLSLQEMKEGIRHILDCKNDECCGMYREIMGHYQDAETTTAFLRGLR